MVYPLPGLAAGDLVHPAWELEGEEMQRSLRALAPCMR